MQRADSVDRVYLFAISPNDYAISPNDYTNKMSEKDSFTLFPRDKVNKILKHLLP